MALIDFILNLAGLLLWLHWRSLRFDPMARGRPVTLVGTLKSAEPRQIKLWHDLVGLGILLVVRAWMYWQIGSATGWNARINLEVVVLAFRSDFFTTALLYSFLSFARILLVFYFWLLTLALINGLRNDSDPIQKLIRLHLGWMTRLPVLLVLLVPLIVTVAIWIPLNPLLSSFGIVNPGRSVGQVAGQGALVALALVTSLKYLLPTMLLLYLVVNYVYLGRSPVWDFVTNTSRRLLTPLNWLPLRLGRFDLTPFVGAIVLLVVLDALPNYLLARFPDLRQSLWPA